MTSARANGLRRADRPARQLRAALAAAALVPFVVACSSSKSSSNGRVGTGKCVTATGGAYTIVAKNTEWNTSCIVLHGTSITFTIRNDDRGILHNLNVMKAPGKYKTDLVPGPATQTLALKGLTPGTTYTYVCDLHSNMIGQLQVK